MGQTFCPHIRSKMEVRSLRSFREERGKALKTEANLCESLGRGRKPQLHSMLGLRTVATSLRVLAAAGAGRSRAQSVCQADHLCCLGDFIQRHSTKKYP